MEMTAIRSITYSSAAVGPSIYDDMANAGTAAIGAQPVELCCECEKPANPTSSSNGKV